MLRLRRQLITAWSTDRQPGRLCDFQSSLLRRVLWSNKPDVRSRSWRSWHSA